MSASNEIVLLGVALAVGLLVGAERGWSEREVEEGQRLAGLRTFGLLGLLGGAVGILASQFHVMVLALSFIGVALVLVAAYVTNRSRRDDVGITTLVAALLTFIYGAMVVAGHMAAAAAAAVVTALLLGLKPVLHGWLRKLETNEFMAGLKLLTISVVLLPVLPNQDYGPWKALNPYEIWWMVVLIAAISFSGYVAVRIAGPEKGIPFTGLFAGLASSTALTLHFSKLAAHEPNSLRLYATGILFACGMMFPRIALVTFVISPALTSDLALPLAMMASVVFIPAIVYWRRTPKIDAYGGAILQNPLELQSALRFGLLLACIMFASEGIRAWLGNAGVLLLATVSGIADVDAISLSLSRMTLETLAISTAATGIILASAVNNIAKGALATVVGGRRLGFLVAVPLFAAAVVGMLALWLA